jgi:hypothetical protein
MTWKSRNQNNVVEFPNSENRELLEQKKTLAETVKSIEDKMNAPYWDVLLFSDKELQVMANFGETIKFAERTASRIAAVLSTFILKKQSEEDLFKYDL